MGSSFKSSIMLHHPGLSVLAPLVLALSHSKSMDLFHPFLFYPHTRREFQHPSLCGHDVSKDTNLYVLLDSVYRGPMVWIQQITSC